MSSAHTYSRPHPRGPRTRGIMKKGRCDKHAGCALHVSNICQAGSVSIERLRVLRVYFHIFLLHPHCPRHHLKQSGLLPHGPLCSCRCCYLWAKDQAHASAAAPSEKEARIAPHPALSVAPSRHHGSSYTPTRHLAQRQATHTTAPPLRKQPPSSKSWRL